MQIPELNIVVLNALELHSTYEIQEFSFNQKEKFLVIASGNALPTGKVIFMKYNAIFCDEGSYKRILDNDSTFTSVVIISASGEKHAPIIINELRSKNINTYLITCNSDSSAAKLLPKEHIISTKSNIEPITYNTSTYMGMMLPFTKENPASIKEYILNKVDPMLKNIGDYEAYYIILQPKYQAISEMFVTKFDELFGGRINGRCYTLTQTMHAKTVVPWEKELFISFGYENKVFGSARLNIPLPDEAGFVTMMAIGYYVIGKLQQEKHPWFIENADIYMGQQKLFFNDAELCSI